MTMESALASLCASFPFSGGDIFCNSPASNQNELHDGHPSISIGSISVPSILENTISRIRMCESHSGQSRSASEPSCSNAECIWLSLCCEIVDVAASALSSMPEHSLQWWIPWRANVDLSESSGGTSAEPSLGQD